MKKQENCAIINDVVNKIQMTEPKNSVASWLTALTFLGSVIWILFSTSLIIARFSCFSRNLYLSTVLLSRYLLGWDSSYLVPIYPKTLHSSEECPTPCIIHVFDSLFKRYIYRLRRSPDLPSITGRVFDEVASHLFSLLIPVRLAFHQVF